MTSINLLKLLLKRKHEIFLHNISTFKVHFHLEASHLMLPLCCETIVTPIERLLNIINTAVPVRLVNFVHLTYKDF